MNLQLGRLLISLMLGTVLLISSLLALEISHFNLAKASTDGYALGGPMNGNSHSALSTRARQGQLQNLSNFISVNSIWIDNKRKGWEQTEAYSPSDVLGDNGALGNLDWITTTMAHDCSHLYIRYELNDGPSILTEGARYNLLLDIDENRDTGFHGWGNSFSIGADVLVQGATIFTFAGTTQEDWTWNLLQGYSVDDQEASNSIRDIEYKIPISDLDVFGNGVIGFDWIIWADHTWGTSAVPITDTDFYPDGGYRGGDFNTYTFDYTRPASLFPNPERGLFRQTNTHAPYGDMTLAGYQPLSTDPGTAMLKCYREHNGITLIHRNFWLGEFVTSTISTDYLAKMQADFDAVRAAGTKVIVRFAYTPVYTEPAICAGGSALFGATKERIISHTRELSEVMHTNSDVIAAVQAGFIGGWGEWSGSCHFDCDVNWDDCGEVLSATLEMVPDDLMVQVRTPRYKQRVFSTTQPISPGQAHKGTKFARTAHHNDCFLCNPIDAGTYDNPLIEYPYLHDETKYLAMGGEAGDFNQISESDPNRLKCETALEELEYFHWSFISIDWFRGTHDIWRDGGCFEEIERRLGYRLSLTDSTYSNEIRPGELFTIDINLQNDGWAAPYNSRTVELVLSSTTSSEIYTVTLPDDLRFWLADNDGVHTLKHSLCTSTTLVPGQYSLLLNLPDRAPSLYTVPAYSVRLANTIWDDKTGYNDLSHTLLVTEPPELIGPIDSPFFIKVCDNKLYLPVILKQYPGKNTILTEPVN